MNILQEMLHDGLRSLWFKRQIFQTVFAWQTAGIIKKLDKSIGFDEAHVRFWAHHWNGKRVFWKKHLKIEYIDILAERVPDF
jgi:hypothetical protein